MRCKVYNKDWVLVEKYGQRGEFGDLYIPCLKHYSPDDTVGEMLLELRKELIRERDEIIAQQKILSKEKRFDEAKELSKESKYLLKKYRAVCLYIPYIAKAPKDCPYVECRVWSLELEEELDEIALLIELEYYKLSDRINVKSIAA